MLQNRNTLFSFFLKSFLILFEKQQTDYATVNKICDNASKSVRIDTLERLMKALDCEVQDLFTEE